ncbi:MAG: NADP-dependent malic enzyme [Halobacteriovoraceae bacterium]|nr:NADP-dependent malic enzyme [Halobacteriovoraceae bacterium]MBT5093748.1 NADP-dependent malic enzyme [Halobacteriovoraceae bacterium]
MNEDKKREKDKQEALDYHQVGRPGKIEILSTKSTLTSKDLALAYSPGVAWPCLEIADDPEAAYKYTIKGNLVGVISNGSAVLGLGNIGPLAGKPVMEGKGILFKRFADIDVFDIEIDADTVDKMVNVISALEPTFGGVNLEDIKAPECFEVERQLVEKMNIPVFHDDQHGTAIICSAAFLNALEIAKKKIENIRIVFSGAGAAASACAQLVMDLGVKPENLFMCDSKGVIYKGRTAGMNKYKEQFANDTKLRTLADALDGADAFIGCSARGVLSKEMVGTMAKDPIIFAMANPEPEIMPHEVAEVRDDALMATGRSDFPNQVNNVLCFPFLFRGALDVRATKINTEMKMAAVYALADLAKEEVPDEVRMAYGNEDFKFGRNYLIPKPFDTRVLTRVTPAVAKAAMDSGVAKLKIDNLTDYATNLENRLGTSAEFMKSLRDRLDTYVKQKNKKVKVVFAEGSNARILEAAKILKDDDKIEPILLGNKERILKKMKKIGLDSLKDLQIVTPDRDENFNGFYKEYGEARSREGVSLSHAEDVMALENYFGSMMLRKGLVDAFIAGPTLSYPDCFVPIMNVVGTVDQQRAAGVYIMVFKNRILFLADCTAQVEPNAENLAEIAANTAQLFRHLMRREPRIAFLSFSNFGSNRHPQAKKVKNAVRIAKENYPMLNVEGELQADVAVNKGVLEKLFDFSNLNGETDILIFPELNSANISYKLLSQLSDGQAIGPILVPMKGTVNIVQRTAPVSEIVNMAYLTALLAEEENNFNNK